jgi:hypothetical protein
MLLGRQDGGGTYRRHLDCKIRVQEENGINTQLLLFASLREITCDAEACLFSSPAGFGF